MLFRTKESSTIRVNENLSNVSWFEKKDCP